MRKELFLISFLGMGLACGGDDTTNIALGNDSGGNPDGTLTDGSGGGNDTSTPTDSGVLPDGAVVLPDGAVVTDAGVDSGIPNGGLQPNPLGVQCGASLSCTFPNTCCVTSAADGGAIDKCGGGCNGVKLECDEAADCPATVLADGGKLPQVCCYERANGSIVGSSCHADCAGGGGSRTQACRTNAECLTGTCAVRNCSGLVSPVETCNPIPNICP